MRLIKFESDYHNLIEIYNKADFPAYCFLRKDGNDYYQLHEPAICKDYASDIIFVNLYPEIKHKIFPIYGMKYDPEESPISSDKLFLSYEGSVGEISNVKKNWGLLVDASKLSRRMIPKYYEIDDKTLIIEASKKWLHWKFDIGVFLFLLRIACRSNTYSEYENINEFLLKGNHNSDKKHIDIIFKKAPMSWFLKNMKSITQLSNKVEPENIIKYLGGKESFHNIGFISVIQGDMSHDWVDYDNYKFPWVEWNANMNKLLEKENV